MYTPSITSSMSDAHDIEMYDMSLAKSSSNHSNNLSNLIKTSTSAKKPNLSFKTKIFLAYFQLYSIVSTFSVPWPVAFHKFMSTFAIVNLDILSCTLSLACKFDANYYSKVTFSFILPPIMIGFILLFYALPIWATKIINAKTALQKRQFRRQLWDNVWRMSLFILFLLYPGVTSVMFGFTNCLEVEGINYLVVDFRIKCDDQKYTNYLVLASFGIIVYTFGTPFFFFYQLIRNKEKFSDSRVRTRNGLLYDGYSESNWWWELLDMFHKFFISAILIVSHQSAQMRIGMCVSMAYAICILLRNPYFRKGDDRLHLLVQSALFTLFLSGEIVDRQVKNPTGFVSNLSEEWASFSLFVVSVFTIITFSIQFAHVVSKKCKYYLGYPDHLEFSTRNKCCQWLYKLNARIF